MFAEDVVGAFHHSTIRPGGRLPLQDGNLAARAGAAFIDDRLRLRLADPDPVGADIDVGIVVRPHVDLNDVDAGFFGAFQKLGVGLNVGIVDDNNVRLLRDERGDGLGAAIRAELRVPDLELHAETVGLFFHDRRPPLSEVDAHCDRDEGDRFALERLEVIGAPRIVDSLGDGVRRNGQREHEPEGRRDLSLSHNSFSLVS
jgi:hypothetical protein